MRRRLPPAAVLDVDVESAHAEAVRPGPLHIDVCRQHRNLAIEADVDVAVGERLLPCRSLRDGGDVLRLRLRCPVGVGIAEIVREKTLQAGFILLDRGLGPAGGSLADGLRRIGGVNRSRGKKEER